jgi:acyl dehydratase
MALPVEKLGTAYDPLTSEIDPERAVRYAAATNDENPAYASGKVAPPVFGVVPTWEAMGTATADMVPAEAAMFIVHGEQDMHFHQPLTPGRSLVSRAQPYSVRVGGSGTRLTVKVESVDGVSDEAVLTQYITIFIRGMTDGESGGPDKPDHSFPEAARSSEAGSARIHVDDDQTYRYRDASGDMMPIHVDDEFARSVGLPGIIAHGLCTMAMCSQAVIGSVADGDPTRLKRLAVRFAANVFPGSDVDVTLYDAGSVEGRSAYAFEATSRGDVVIKNGWAEVD